MTSDDSTMMTSLTDHSVESILRHGDVTGHVTGSREASPTKDGVYSSSASAGGSGGSSKPRLVLECRDLWHQFYGLNTEMVITKSGRFVYTQCTLLCYRRGRNTSPACPSVCLFWSRLESSTPIAYRV